MRTFAIALLAGLIGFSTAFSADEDKKIVGTWEVVKSADAAAGTLITFTDKGKLRIVFKKEGGKDTTYEGSYEIKGKKLITKVEFMGKVNSEEVEITDLTDDKLVTKDSKSKVDELKKIKEKGKN